MTSKDRTMLHRAFAAAKMHGENSEPEHEAGDLQDMLRKAVEIMAPHQREELFGSDEVAGLIEQEG